MEKPTTTFPTLLSQLLQERLRELGIAEGQLKAWGRSHGFRRHYQLLWYNVTGRAVSRDQFLVRLAVALGMDPVVVVLTGHADRATPSFKNYFLAARQRYQAFPQLAQGWAALDDGARQQLLAIIARPALARTLVQLMGELQSREGDHGRAR